MEFTVMDPPDANVLARGAFLGGPDYEVVEESNGTVYWQVVGDTDRVWAGPDAASFRRIVAAWQRCVAE